MDSLCDSPISGAPDVVFSWNFAGLSGVYRLLGPVFCAASDGKVGICAPAGNACADLASDPLNCGGFGFTCPAGQTCAHGVCSGTPVECGLGRIGGFCNLDAGLEVCCPGVGCTDLSSDVANCGSCSQTCSPGQSCVDGGCQ